MFDIKNIMKDLLSDLKEHNSEVSGTDFQKVWSQVEDKINNEPPPRIAFLGNSGVGKSSTLNALFNAGQAVSHTKACTQTEGLIEISAETIKGQKGVLMIYDMPGLDESISSQEKHLETYERVLKDVDVAIWVLEAHNRGMRSIQDAITNNIRRMNPTLVNRIVFALNKVDLIHPGEKAWHALANLPNSEQEENIKKRIKDVQEKILEILPEWTGEIVGFSAEKRYNLPKLFSVMLNSVPLERRWIITSRKALSNFLELVDESLLPEGAEIKKSKTSVDNSSDLIEVLKQMSPTEIKQLASQNKSAFQSILNQINKK